jgi:hypothetical protein
MLTTRSRAKSGDELRVADRLAPDFTQKASEGAPVNGMTPLPAEWNLPVTVKSPSKIRRVR